MSATIGINDLKFVIFGAGHDYTLADSGDGDVQIYSHPYVPLNSVNYAGMYYFLVPDEDGNPMDAVKDDIAHCTFTPAIGDAFTAEGETTVSCHYHREYVYGEETLVVDKTVSQKITVVNHGSVSNAAHYSTLLGINIRCDVYSDGYAFFRPYTTTEVGANTYLSDLNSGVKKTSSIPWRASSLGYGATSFARGNTLTDISELAFADVSSVTKISLLFDTYVEDISALAEWDVSECEDMRNFLYYNSKLADISALENWNTGKVKDLWGAFSGCTSLPNLHGLENWDVSNVTNMYGLLSSCENLTDISALMNWDTSSVTSLESFLNMHNSDPKLTSLHGLENWDVSKVTDMASFMQECRRITSLAELANWSPKPTSLYQAFVGLSIKNLDGLENFDTSNCTIFDSTFSGNFYLTDCDGVSGWDVSNGNSFTYMFNGAWWLTSLSFINGWNIGGDCGFMFYIASVLSLDDVTLNLTRVIGYGNMFRSRQLQYSSKLGKDVVPISGVWYDRNANVYTVGEVDDYEHPLSDYSHDASNAQNWTVTGSNRLAFNADVWSNVPTWN